MSRFGVRFVQTFSLLLPEKDVRVRVVMVLLVARGEKPKAKTRSLRRPPCRPPSRPPSALRQRPRELPPRPHSRSRRPRVARTPPAGLVSAGLAGPMRVLVVPALVATTSRPGARHGEQRQGAVGVEYLFAQAAWRDVDEGGDAGERVVCEGHAVFGGAGWRRKRSRGVGRQSLFFASPAVIGKE